MKNFRLRTMAGGVLLAGLFACSEPKFETGSYQVIPLPMDIAETVGAAPFIIRPSTTVCYPEGNEALERTARFLASYIKEVTGTEVRRARRRAARTASCWTLTRDWATRRRTCWT